MKLFTALFFLLGILGFTTSDESVDNYVTMVLENFSEAMRTGVPVLGIPVLDPFSIGYVEVPEITYPQYKLKANASDNIITGQSYYTPTYVHIDLKNLSNHITLDLTGIRVDGQYWCDGMLMYVFPIFGDGPYYLEVNQILVDGIGGIYLTSDGYMQLTSVEATLTFENMVVYFENFLGGGSFGDEMNEAMSQMGTLLFEAMLPKLEEALIPAMVTYINAALMQHTLDEIISGALPTPPRSIGLTY